jgi:hypothetical protein
MLIGKSAVITGSGLGIARAFAGQGAGNLVDGGWTAQ